ANAREQQRAADDAGCSRRRRAKERAAATADRRGGGVLTLPLSLSARTLAVTRLGLLHRLAAVPDRPRVTRRHVRNRAARGASAEQRVAHGVEEAAGLRRRGRLRRFQLLDAVMSTLQRFVLQ